MQAGDRVYIVGKDHPHRTKSGELIVFEPYGPKMFGWEGWKVETDDGFKCYAKPSDLKAAK